MPITSRTYYKPLASVFWSSTEAEREMLVQIARLTVLYEDLRIESDGAQQEHIAVLDDTGLNTRRFYFVRRTLATLSEMAQAFNKLNADHEFRQHVLAVMPPQARREWGDAVKFFNQKHSFLKAWRNDVGGHFHDAAARYAVENAEHETVASLELFRRGTGAGIRMHFAYALVALAMTKNRESHTVEQFLTDAFTFLVDASAHASNAVQIIAHVYLLDRFRSKL